MVQDPSLLAVHDSTTSTSECSRTADAVHETISVVCATIDAVRNARQLSTFRIEEAQLSICVMEKMLSCHTDDGEPIAHLFPAGECHHSITSPPAHATKRIATSVSSGVGNVVPRRYRLMRPPSMRLRMKCRQTIRPPRMGAIPIAARAPRYHRMTSPSLQMLVPVGK